MHDTGADGVAVAVCIGLFIERRWFYSQVSFA